MTLFDPEMSGLFLFRMGMLGSIGADADIIVARYAIYNVMFSAIMVRSFMPRLTVDSPIRIQRRCFTCEPMAFNMTHRSTFETIDIGIGIGIGIGIAMRVSMCRLSRTG
jgi:hypothetical protein